MHSCSYLSLCGRILFFFPHEKDPNVILCPCAGQCMYEMAHTKPRRLQWTWLGHAEMTYGPCTIYVSTLQMYILLQFNHQEVT